ncbi:hypothetical protein [Aquipuribacter hungaricus]|uniref:SAF domain-containing protein n=1 Tax=Aquipuribacter hungaricus TaxID=545624 RepID=A0ABV7WD70_9MICO
MRTPAWPSGAGRVGFDPGSRRRVRRTAARARPLLLPVAVVLATALALGAGPGTDAVGLPPPGLVVPVDRVLVAVQPADPAVLALAPPGSRVDVYAAVSPVASDPFAEGPAPPGQRVVDGALVVGPPAVGGLTGAGPVDGAGGGGSGLLTGAPAATGIALAVTDGEAAALAARAGTALLVAVRGQP